MTYERQMTETLTCQMCSNTWDRELVRGRKPRFCPSCLEKSLVIVSMSQQTEDSTKNEKLDPSNKMIWICQLCERPFTTYVPLCEPPTCFNPEKHERKHVEMIPYTKDYKKLSA